MSPFWGVSEGLLSLQPRTRASFAATTSSLQQASTFPPPPLVPILLAFLLPLLSQTCR